MHTSGMAEGKEGRWWRRTYFIRDIVSQEVALCRWQAV